MSSLMDKPGSQHFWRTLDGSLADDPSFRERLQRISSEIEAITNETTRRTFIEIDGRVHRAHRPDRVHAVAGQIVAYVRQPEEIIPGKPLYATTRASAGRQPGCSSRRTKAGRRLEGNPLHPASLGACDAFAQAAILGLYDPERARTLSNLGDIRPWPEFLGMIRAAVTAQLPLKGAGIRILTETVNSPTLAGQIRDLLQRFPSAKWHQWDPAGLTNTRAGARLAFDENVLPTYRFDRADVIVSLDADFSDQGRAGWRRTRVCIAAASRAGRSYESSVHRRDDAHVDRFARRLSIPRGHLRFQTSPLRSRPRWGPALVLAATSASPKAGRNVSRRLPTTFVRTAAQASWLRGNRNLLLSTRSRI